MLRNYHDSKMDLAIIVITSLSLEFIGVFIGGNYHYFVFLVHIYIVDQISITIMKHIKFEKYFQNICRSPG